MVGREERVWKWAFWDQASVVVGMAVVMLVVMAVGSTDWRVASCGGAGDCERVEGRCGGVDNQMNGMLRG